MLDIFAALDGRGASSPAWVFASATPRPMAIARRCILTHRLRLVPSGDYHLRVLSSVLNCQPAPDLE